MLSRLRGRSRPELLTRARQQVLAIGERYGIAGVAGRVPEFRSDLPASSDHWTVSRFAPPRLPLGAESVDAVGAAIRDAWPEVAAGYVANATRIDRGELSLMGHAGLQLGSPPDWHEEPIARVRSPRAHWSTIPYLERHVVGDHKVLWEFNRHQYFVSLAQAWAVSGDAQCVRLFMAHMNSWIAANPPHLGVNWASSLEVAYRAISWCWALRMFRHADGIDAAFMQRVYASLDAHGRHIERYLSTYFSPNTHLTGEALGLLYLGATFPELARSETWRTCGSRILDEQARRQVYSDGVYFEQATQYHRYTTEIYLHYLLLAEASGDAASPVVRPVLHRLFDVLLALTRADGTMPLIGDDDGGRLVQLDDRRPDQLRGLLAVGAVVLDRSDLARAGGDPDYLAWMLGADAIDRWLELRSMSSATPLRCAFPVGGLFVMREDEPDSPDHVVIDAGPHGALSCGHSHADALSVVVSCGGGPLFVDAGTYTYVGAERNQFRGASVHNLFTVDGRAPSQPASPFRWETRSDGRMTEWHRTPDFSWIRGIESAYQDAVPSLRHERCVFRPRGGVIVIRDAIVGGASTSARLRWQCAADVEPALRSRTGTATVIDLCRDDRVVATLVITGGEGVVGIVASEVSPQFGVKQPASAIEWVGTVTGAASLSSIILDWHVLRQHHVTVTNADQAMTELNTPGDELATDTHYDLHLESSVPFARPSFRMEAPVVWHEAPTSCDGGRTLGIGFTSVWTTHEQLESQAADRWALVSHAGAVTETRHGALFAEKH